MVSQAASFHVTLTQEKTYEITLFLFPLKIKYLEINSQYFTLKVPISPVSKGCNAEP